ncbi:MAG: hypothetical protein RIS87_1347, partial [Pseudomonadota bacterium]
VLATCGQSHLAVAGATVTAVADFTGSVDLSVLLAQPDNKLASNMEVNRAADFFIN